MFGEILGSIAGNLLGQWASSAIDSHYQGQLIDRQLAAQKELFEFENSNKHQFEVADLKAAGLNPILSAMNPSAVGVGGINAPAYQGRSDLVSSAVQLAQQRKSLDIQQQTAEAAGMQAVAAIQQARNGEISSAADALKKETESAIMWRKADAELEEIRSRTGRNISETSYHGALTKMTGNQAVKLAEETSGVRLDNDTRERLRKAYDSGSVGDAIFIAKNVPGLDPASRAALVSAFIGSKWRNRKEKGNHYVGYGSSRGWSASSFSDLPRYGSLSD